MVVGLKLVKEGKAQAFISAGNTGAVLAGGVFVVGRIKGIIDHAYVQQYQM